ncbi:hypothetical protein BKA57DRAFT_444347 [Linnemannia elongata]|nr:hypothetical protein BKA57DRAFT_444347 [Linnemannia elongata]
MSSYQTYSSHHSNNNNSSSQHPYSSRSTSPATTLSPPSPTTGSRGGASATTSTSINIDSQTPIYTIDYSHSNTSGSVGAQRSASPSSPPLGSPTSTLHSNNSRSDTFNSQKRTASPTMAFSNTPLPEPTRWKRVRLTVMKLATVERLQLLWGLLALLGTVSWIALMPAYSFRNGLGHGTFKDPSYTLFLVATVGTSLSAIWQSLCPFLIRQSQRALLPRIINHPSTQTATIIVSVVLTVLNFFSWIILAAGGDTGAHTDCMTGPLATKPGYLSQCRAVNVAIAVDAVVFLLWIPISVVIVCGTVERGLWWWGEDDGWAQGEGIGGSNMMSEEEFDMKIGVGGSKRIKRRQTVFPTEEEQAEHPGMVMIQQPKPAFVTPIASQFRSNSGGFGDDLENGDDEDFGNFTPSSYRRHHQQRQQQQRQRLQRKASTNSLSSRLSTFFGAGWGSDAMPPPSSSSPTEPVPALPPMPVMPSQYAQENARNAAAAAAKANGGDTVTASTRKKKVEEKKKEEDEKEAVEDIPLHGDSYASQWHSRWS